MPLNQNLTEHQIEKTRDLLKTHDATLIAHYYTSPDIQAMAEQTGGYVSDSLDMAKFGAASKHQTLVIAGVHFMGETAKILSPHKTIKVLEPEATCSLDLGCPPKAFETFCQEYKDRTVVVYANTSAKIKAMADWVVTSSIGLEVIQMLHQRGEKILWAPDKYLGQYIQKQTGADMVLWDGQCIVHEEFKAEALSQMMRAYPQAKVLVHPESPCRVIDLADKVGSTKQLLNFAIEDAAQTFIVATEEGIFYQMKKEAPTKTFLLAPTGGHGATCQSCGRCPWMAMNTLDQLSNCLNSEDHTIHIDPKIIEDASQSIQRMIAFKSPL